MKYTITYATNFLRVFRVPDDFPSDYCFAGGHPVKFVMVDWFNAFSEHDFWNNQIKTFDETDVQYLEHVESLREYIKGKTYFKPDHTFMVLTDYGDVFVINPEKRAFNLQLEYVAIMNKAKETQMIVCHRPRTNKHAGKKMRDKKRRHNERKRLRQKW